LIAELASTARELGAPCNCAEVESLGVMVHRIMTYGTRQFHTLEHVFSFLDGADALTVLAAVFHDLIYWQIDGGLPDEAAALLAPYVDTGGRTPRLKPDAAGEGFDDCAALFGFRPGQELPPYGGANEFLSALCMQAALAGRVGRRDRLAVAVCVAASIPFRGKDAEGLDLGAALERRLRGAAAAAGLETDEAWIGSTLRRAVDFANADVGGFADSDTATFLSDTWKLLPESNAGLRRPGVFSVAEYRTALQKMLGFFLTLDPATIFHAYGGRPDPAEFGRLEAAAKLNLDRAATYLRAKLLAVGFIEAVARVSGGDAPMALFMGDAPSGSAEAATGLTDLLEPLPTPPWLDQGHPVYRLLKDGRLEESSFDLRNSPLALRLYCALAPAAWAERVGAADRFFSGGIDADAFLDGFPRAMRDEIVGAVERLAPTRADALRAWREARP
jgi:hypothetical protein